MNTLAIEVILHCYYSPRPVPNYETRVVKETVSKFLDAGLIQSSDEFGVYIVTPRGRAWVEMLLDTPYPTCQWVDPRRHKTKI